MSGKNAQQDLDSILDDALEAFEGTIPSQRNPIEEDVEEAPPITDESFVQVTREETAPPPVDVDDTGKVLEDALRALGQLGVSNNDDDRGDDVTEADMKLVEEFVTSLGESLSGLGAADFLNSKPTSTESVNGTAPNNGNETGSSSTGMNGTSSETKDTTQERNSNQPVVEKLVDSIVGHLLSEDVLKAPMLQMRTAYAEWLPQHENELSEIDTQRFRRQHELIEKICQNYEQGANLSEIMELLSRMEETGAIPEAVMNQLSTEDSMDGFLGRLGGLDVKK